MSGFKIRILTTGPHIVNDLGITLDVAGAAPVTEDLTDLAPQDIARSADLLALITGDDILIVDARDDSDTTFLTKAESTDAVENHNDTHFGVSGGRFGPADDPTNAFLDDFVLEYVSSTDTWQPFPHEHLFAGQGDTIGEVIAGMGIDGTDTTYTYDPSDTFLVGQGLQDETYYDGDSNFLNGSFVGGDGVGGTSYSVSDVITLSDGSTVTVDAVDVNGDVTAFTVTTSGETIVTEGVALTQTGVVPAGGLGFTLTPEQRNTTPGSMQWSVNDVFLRNSVSDSYTGTGTLNFASGTTLAIDSGASITIDAGATAATIDTPGGGFVNDNDLINKFYVDQVAAGLDWKESARVGTAPSDGPAANGSFGGLIAAQDETNYNGAGSNGTFTAGSGYAALDTITLTDGTVITVDAVSVGAVTDFTVTTAGTTNTAGTTVSQASTSGGGSSFDITTGTANISGVYDPTGGTATTGQITGLDLSSGSGDSIDGLFFTGTDTTGLVIGDRILVKDQADAKQNGIYFIDTGSVATSVTLTRAEDQDGTPTSEVSGGNTVFVEDTLTINGSSTNSNTTWSVLWDGDVTLNTDPVNWTQTAGAGAIVARLGLSNDGTIFDLDVDDLASETITTSDSIAFHDAGGTPNSSGSITRKTTVSDFLADLDIVSGITSNGLIRRTGDDTYEQIAIVEDTTAGLEGANVVNGGIGDTGNIEIGLDIQNLTPTSGVTTTDRLAVWDGTNNVYYTVAQLAGAAGASDSYTIWTNTGNGSGPTIGPASAADTIDWNGGIGIDITTTSGTPDTITFDFTDSGMADTAITTSDTIPFFDASNSGEAEFRTVSSLITDLGLISGAYATVTGDTGSASASGSDTINIIGATSGGITTVASEPGTDQLTIGITGADLATGSATLAPADFIIVNDSTDTASTLSQKYTFTDMITDLGLITTTNITAYASITGGDGGTATAIGQDTITFNGTGINIQSTNAGAGADTVAFVLDIGDLGTTANAIVAADEVAINDITDGVTYRHTWTDVITDLGLLTSSNTVNYTTYGGDSGTASPATNTDTINFVGGTNGGITTVASEPGTDEIAFSITPIDLTTGGATLTTSDFIIVSDSADAVSTVALKYTFSDMITDLNILTTTTGVTDAYSFITGGDGGVQAVAIGEDTITVNGTGINVTTTNGGAGADTLDLVLDISDLTAGAGTIIPGDGVAINDGGTTVQYLWSDVIADLGLLTAVTASTNEDLVGIDVTGGSVIGLDILGLTAAGDDMAATDEFPLHDKSEGTAGANGKITGTNIAEGTAAILGITGLTFTDINGQSMLTGIDSTRSSKVLSIDSHPYQWSDNKIDDNDWLNIGNAADADNGWIMPFDGTIVGATGFTEDGKTATMAIDVYIDGVDSGPVGTLVGSGNTSFTSTTLDINFTQSQKLRLRADRTAGSGGIEDVNVMVMVRWRDV